MSSTLDFANSFISGLAAIAPLIPVYGTIAEVPLAELAKAMPSIESTVESWMTSGHVTIQDVQNAAAAQIMADNVAKDTPGGGV